MGSSLQTDSCYEISVYTQFESSCFPITFRNNLNVIATQFKFHFN